MIIEIALIIIILIIVFTEFLKDIFISYFQKNDIHDRCIYARENFEEDDIFNRQLNKSLILN